jgi:hypothetical protein
MCRRTTAVEIHVDPDATDKQIEAIHLWIIGREHTLADPSGVEEPVSFHFSILQIDELLETFNTIKETPDLN